MTSLPPPEMPKYSNTSINNLAPKRDSKAVGALVCGIVGLLVFGIVLGGVAIGLGVQSRKNIRSSQGLLTGEGFAKAAVILGILDVATFFLLLISR